MNDDEYLTSVREQYENYPYPARLPEDEKRTLFVNPVDHLGNISHYCYAGKRDFRKGARLLVAGGGTGDAVMFLGEQLRDTDAEIVYLDLSHASMEVARARAKVRGLTNITWHQRSLLELPNMDIGTFDYINCCGVLHHLKDPVKGLNALASVLDEHGAMDIMVYAQYGRTAIYQMQELMRMINRGENNLQQCVDNTHTAIAELPKENWYKRDEQRWTGDLEDLGDIEVYDLFLHSQDRAYTVPQIYRWLDECNLNMAGFSGFSGQKLKYAVDTYARDEKFRDLVSQLPVEQQQAIAELMNGNIKTHTFYVSKQKNTLADHMDFNLVPFYSFTFAPPEALFNDFSKNPTKALEINLGNKIGSLKLEQAAYTRHILRYLNGMRSLGEIVQCIKDDFVTDSEVFNENEMLADYNALFEKFNLYELIFMRAKDIKPYKNYDQLVAETLKRHAPVMKSTGISYSYTM